MQTSLVTLRLRLWDLLRWEKETDINTLFHGFLLSKGGLSERDGINLIMYYIFVYF